MKHAPLQIMFRLFAPNGWLGRLLLLSLVVALTTATATAQPVKLFDFYGYPNAGSQPMGNVTISPDGGTLYGYTYSGGTTYYGTVFSIGTNGSNHTMLHIFTTNLTDGMQPYSGAPLLLNGKLYGMTRHGGANGTGTRNGAVYSMDTNGNNFTLLYSFVGSTNDGWHPDAGLTASADGTTLYGTAQDGSTNVGGVVFKIGANGTGYTRWHSFPEFAGDGNMPMGTLARYGTKLYGSTYNGGASNSGCIFSINTDGSGYNRLYSLNGGNEGQYIYNSLVLSADGAKLFGMGFQWGTSNWGTVFSVDTDGNNFAVLHTFTGQAQNDGGYPYGSLALAPDNTTLFGMTTYGGVSNWGTIFSVKTDGAEYTNLWSFRGGTGGGYDGGRPRGAPTISADGKTLYGMTYQGGASNRGVLFSFPINAGPSVVSPPTTLPSNNYAALWNDFETPFTASNTPAGGYPATGWSKAILSNNTDWVWATNGINGNPARARTNAWVNPTLGTSNRFALFGAGSYGNVTRLFSPSVDLSKFTATPTMSFWHVQVPWPSDQDYLLVYVATNAGTATRTNGLSRMVGQDYLGWRCLAFYSVGVPAWTNRTLALTNLAFTTNMAFMFEGIGEYAYGTGVDDLMVYGRTNTLTPDPVYTLTTNLWQDFETTWTASNTPAGGFPVAGWSKAIMSNNTDWIQATNGINNEPIRAWDTVRATSNLWVNPVTGTSNRFARFGSSSYGPVTRLFTPAMDLTGGTMPTMTFWHVQVAWPSDQDYLRVMVHTNFNRNVATNKGSAAVLGWQTLAYYTASQTNWIQRTLSITNYAHTNLVVCFEGISEYAYGTCVDDLKIVSWLKAAVVSQSTITFDSAGGSAVAPITQNEGTAVVAPANPTRAGYSFTSWSPPVPGTMPVDDVTCVAQWQLLPDIAVAGGATTVITTNNFIYGLSTGLTSLDAHVTAVGGATLQIEKSSGTICGTGTKVKVMNGAVLVKTYTVVIFGDVNGDGNSDSIDAGKLVDVENGLITWNPVADACFLKAGDVNGDLTVDGLDVGIVVDVENYLTSINQATGLSY